MYKTDH